MGAMSDWLNLGDAQRLQMWALALGLAMLGFQGLSSAGWINPLNTIYATGPLLWLSALVGGWLPGGKGCVPSMKFQPKLAPPGLPAAR